MKTNIQAAFMPVFIDTNMYIIDRYMTTLSDYLKLVLCYLRYATGMSINIIKQPLGTY